jgi:hypothetical protein
MPPMESLARWTTRLAVMSAYSWLAYALARQDGGLSRDGSLLAAGLALLVGLITVVVVELEDDRVGP